MEIKEVQIETIWQIRKEVMYPDFNLEQVKLKDDELGQHLGLFVDNKLVSIISIFIKNNELQFRKFATLKLHQEKGYGKQLLQHVFNLAKQNNCQLIWCNARTSALGLYEKFGMKSFGETWNKNGHEFIKMRIELI
jgi:phosphoribosylformimino-5-aminoimidazole carboxamide ribotide isomerase